MADSAHVTSLDSLKLLQRAIWKFHEHANTALGDAEAEIQRVMVWLETEQRTYWLGEVRKRQAALSQAKEALRMKQIFKDAAGGRQSVVDELKAVQVATRRLEEAEQKVLAVKKYTTQLQREIMLYKGQVQRFSTMVQSDLPQAAHELDRVIGKLEEYAAVGMGGAQMATSEAGDLTSMKRATDETEATEETEATVEAEPTGQAEASAEAPAAGDAEATQPAEPAAEHAADEQPAADQADAAHEPGPGGETPPGAAPEA